MIMLTDKEIVERLVKIGIKVLDDLKKGENPALNIPLRSLRNVYYDENTGLIKLKDSFQERSYFNIGQSKKFMQTILIADRIKWLVEQNKTLSIRQLFYTLKHTIPGFKENTFDSQDESDPIIEDIEVLINVLRENLNLFASSKGVLAGPMTIIDSGDEIDISKLGSAGYGVPGIVEPDVIKFKDCSADYVLVVEKDAVWARLNEDKYWKKNNCLLLTGKGQPSRAERRILRRLHNELKLPVYVFTDMDPWGYYIYSVYKQGSINLAYFSEKSGVPNAKFLGFKMSDVKNFEMPQDSFIKMGDQDYKRLKELSSYAWFQTKEWQKELKELKKFGNKIEQDALVMKGIEFAAKEYLPKKIENKDWI